MADISLIMKRLKHIDFKNLFATADRVAAETGRSKASVIADIFRCYNRHGAGWVDYETFGMYNMTEAERAKVLTIARNSAMVRKLNDMSYAHIFDDKAEFNEVFAKYVRRDWLRLNGENREAFYAFLADRELFMAKPLDLSCGKGIEKVYRNADGLWYNKELAPCTQEALYDWLMQTRKFLVEEVVIQSEEMNRISPCAVNTVRLITVIVGDEVRVAAGCFRMGREGMDVDNFNHGGISTVFDIETGVILCEAYDKMRNRYPQVPETGVTLKGLQLPRWDEIIATVKEAAWVVPQIRYVGWDVCISDKYGVSLIEGNSYPGQDLSQSPEYESGTYAAFQKACPELNL